MKEKEQIDKNNGQSFVMLRKSGIKAVKTYVAYIVAETFKLPNPNNYKYLIHKDKNKQNNALDNLEWSKYPEDQIYYLY